MKGNCSHNEYAKKIKNAYFPRKKLRNIIFISLLCSPFNTLFLCC
jgi:hypothetical protein